MVRSIGNIPFSQPNGFLPRPRRGDVDLLCDLRRIVEPDSSRDGAPVWILYAVDAATRHDRARNIVLAAPTAETWIALMEKAIAAAGPHYAPSRFAYFEWGPDMWMEPFSAACERLNVVPYRWPSYRPTLAERYTRLLSRRGVGAPSSSGTPVTLLRRP